MITDTYYVNAHKIQIGINVISSRAINIKVNKSKEPNRPVHIARWHSMRSRARSKGISCSMSSDDVLMIISQPCIYCLDNINLSELDRKDSSEGYEIYNVVPACRRCNTIKNNVATFEEMMFIANYLGWRH